MARRVADRDRDRDPVSDLLAELGLRDDPKARWLAEQALDPDNPLQCVDEIALRKLGEARKNSPSA